MVKRHFATTKWKWNHRIVLTVTTRYHTSILVSYLYLHFCEQWRAPHSCYHCHIATKDDTSTYNDYDDYDISHHHLWLTDEWCLVGDGPLLLVNDDGNLVCIFPIYLYICDWLASHSQSSHHLFGLTNTHLSYQHGFCPTNTLVSQMNKPHHRLTHQPCISIHNTFHSQIASFTQQLPVYPTNHAFSLTTPYFAQKPLISFGNYPFTPTTAHSPHQTRVFTHNDAFLPGTTCLPYQPPIFTHDDVFHPTIACFGCWSQFLDLFVLAWDLLAIPGEFCS